MSLTLEVQAIVSRTYLQAFAGQLSNARESRQQLQAA